MQKRDKGFTIVELLIVVAIIIIVPSIVISNFPKVKNQFAVSRAAHIMSQDFRKAQDLALSENIFLDDLGFERRVLGYGIHIDLDLQGNEKYIIYANNNESGLANEFYDNTDHIIFEADLSLIENGVIIKELKNVIGRKASINFSANRPFVKISNLADEREYLEIILALESDIEVTKTLIVNNLGLIEVK